MINDDLDYIFLAPVANWRGGRLFIEPQQSLAAMPQLGHVELAPAPPPLRVPAAPMKRRRPRAARIAKTG
jgi:hypothetical protein